MTYKFRFINPEATEWVEGEGSNEIDAIQEYQLRFRIGIRVKLDVGHFVYFARVEVPSGEQMISRVFWHGLERRGGVRLRQDPYPWGYAEAAVMLGVEESELRSEDGWEQDEVEYH